MAFDMQVGLGPVHIVLDRDTAPLPKKGGRAPPQFSPHLYCGQTAGCIKVPLGMEVGLSLGDCVRWGPSPYPKRGGAPPIFRPTSIVAKRLHGSRCHLVWRWTSAYATLCSMWTLYTREKKGTPIPNQFLAHVYCGQMAEWMKTPLSTEVDVGPGHIVLDRVPAPAKGVQQPPCFRPMSSVATVAHLSYC